jgi:hypothetical protein
MIHVIPTEHCKAAQPVGKTLVQHPLVLLDQQLRCLAKEDDNAIRTRQRGRR